MRIISGSLGGRNFISPKGHKTHPMSEKMRGGLFNALGDITGLTVLDAYSGSGALAFEAISRGASSAVLLDNSKEAKDAILANISSLDLENQASFIKSNVGSWIKSSNETFDLLFCDPPYDNLNYETLESTAFRTKINGLAVYSLPPKADLRLNERFELLITKNYGDSQLQLFRRVF